MAVTISEDKLAEILHVTPRRIREVCRNSRKSPGVYSLLDAVSEFIEQSSNKNQEYITLKRFAEIVGKSEKYIRDLTDKNILDKTDNGYDLISNIKRYIEFLQVDSPAEQYKRTQVEINKIKIEKEAGVLVRADEVKQVYGTAMVTFKQSALTQARKEAVDFLNITERYEAEKKLESFVKRMLTQFSNFSYEGEEDGTKNT